MSGEVTELERIVEWLPEGWLASTVGDVADILDSKRVPLNSEERRVRPGPYPYWGANGIVDYIDDYIFDEPLVLMAEDGGYFDQAATRPICHRLDGRAWVNNHAHIVRPTGADRDYFYYWFVHRDITPFIKGGTRSKLNQAELKRLPIWLPPLDEQRRIAEVLRSVDEAIAASQATLQQSEVALSALSDELFAAATSGGGSEWSQYPLEDMLDNIIDYRGIPPPKAESGIPLLTAKNVRFGYLDFEPREYIAEEDYSGWMRRGLPKAGDIMFTTEAPLGNVAEFPDIKAALGQRTLTLVPNARMLDAKFLKWLLLSRPVQDLIWSHATGSTAKGIKQRTFRKLKFGFPTLDEQVRIAKVLEGIGEARDAAKRASEAYVAMKAHLLSDLLSGRVRVPA